MVATGWEILHGIESCLLTEVPRGRSQEAERTSGGDALRDQRFAALVSAYQAGQSGAPGGGAPGGGAVLLGWRRVGAQRPIEVLIGGAALFGGQDGTGPGAATLLSLPAGARAQRLAAGSAAQGMAAVPYWTSVGAITDGLLVDEDVREQATALRPSLEDSLLSVWQDAFAWLLIAEPIPRGEAEELAGEVADRRRRAQAKAEGSPEYALEADRLERRHRELALAASSGLWRVRLLAGSDTPERAARVGALLCASADLKGLPYALAPRADRCGSLEEILTAGTDGARGPATDLLTAATGSERGSAADPFVAGAGLLSALFRPPTQEIPGVRFALRPEFDVTPENGVGGDPDAVRLGAVLDRNRMPVGDLRLSRSSLNRHTFVCGATGGGKSQTVRGLLEAATGSGLPWLVVEPAKAEYRFMASRLPDDEVAVIRPGDPDMLPAGLNPLEPSTYGGGLHFPLQTHLDMVRALFLASFDPQEPFPQVLSAALTRCYEELGWDLTLNEPAVPGATPRYPTLEDLQETAERVVADIGYSKEITDNVRGFIRIRISSLRLGTTGRFFEGGHPIDFGELLKRNVVFEIEDVGDDKDKAFLMGTVLIRLVEYLRLEQRHTGRLSFPLRHLSVFEEAHRLLRRSEEGGASAHAVEMFAGLLAEIRAYGEGLVIAEQIPGKLVPDVIKNTAAKVVHRLPARDDREAVGATMNITEAQSEFLVTLSPGEAAVFTDGMDQPLLVRMADGTGRENAGPVTTASAAPMVGRRSAACPAACADTPCTLRRLRGAQRLLDVDESRITLWAEMAVAAHLLGWRTPLPGPAMRASLAPTWARDRHLVECAIAQAVDRAVADRPAAVATPAELAEHTARMMSSQLDGADPCPVGEPMWKALPGTRARHYYHGRRTPSTVEHIVGCADPSEHWGKRFAKALSCFERTIRKP
ncbi:ATP-binding protein [Streptomyces sp. P9(2023)]|uniref:ATP-binding protein n=1 Tax=Streptomyces sp. P9(2023) TaxID=3064394 RepID=UPI0028F43751|nr:ATP-binding protein [Streptomyces sp. P9(2023)]MDT9692495.1 ATP-binding protein [Streptomyces sp. P9(2023)]